MLISVLGSSIPSAEPPAPLRRPARKGNRPKMWSPVKPISKRRTYQDDQLTMCVSDEDFLDLPHLDTTLLNLMLGSLSAIKEPDIAAQP